MQRRILQLCFVALFIAMLLPAYASADSADYDVPGGHFYSQARGNADPSKGYVISDAGGVPFWTWYQRLGGVAKLGYPASHRFLWNGFWVQVCQKVILQWRPESNTVVFVNVFDEFNNQGRDAYLRAVRQVPPIADWSGDQGLSWQQVVRRHQALLDSNQAIKNVYFSVSDPVAMYGLPMAPILDTQDAYVMRAQRIVIQQWKKDMPWAKAGQVTIANGGDIAKELRLVPDWTTVPTFKTYPTYLQIGSDGMIYFLLANGQPTDFLKQGTLYRLVPNGTNMEAVYPGLPEQSYQGLFLLNQYPAVMSYIGVDAAFKQGVYLLPPAGTAPQAIGGSSTSFGGAAWSPDGTLLAVVQDQKLSLIDRHSGQRQTLPLPFNFIYSPSWSPDGTRLAIKTAASEAVNKYDLYIISAGASVAPQRIAQDADMTKAVWSPDGMRLAYTEFTNSGNQNNMRLHITGADGSNNHVIANSLLLNIEDWRGDSRELLVGVVSEQFSLAELYRIDAQTGAKTLLVGQGAREARWLPDNQTVVYVYENQIWRVRLDGANRQILTTVGR